MGIGWGMSSDCEDESRQISLLSNQVEEHRREKSRWNSIESESWEDMYTFLKLGGRSQLSSNPCHPCLHAAHHCHHFPLRLLHRVQVVWFGQSASIYIKRRRLVHSYFNGNKTFIMWMNSFWSIVRLLWFEMLAHRSRCLWTHLHCQFLGETPIFTFFYITWQLPSR